MQLRAHTHWASCIERNLLRANQNKVTEETFVGSIEDKRQAKAFLHSCIDPVHTMHVAKNVDKMAPLNILSMFATAVETPRILNSSSVSEHPRYCV